MKWRKKMGNEALILAQYLGAKNINDELISRYQNIISKLGLILNKKEESVLNILFKTPQLLPFIDGGLAILNPNHMLRKRILAMSALLETDPNFISLFLNKNKQSFPILRFLWRGISGVLKGGIGVILIKVLGWK
jgi:hypothetical protein